MLYRRQVVIIVVVAFVEFFVEVLQLSKPRSFVRFLHYLFLPLLVGLEVNPCIRVCPVVVEHVGDFSVFRFLIADEIRAEHEVIQLHLFWCRTVALVVEYRGVWPIIIVVILVYQVADVSE